MLIYKIDQKKNMSKKEKILRFVIYLLSGVVLLNSIIVMLGWLTSNRSIIQLHHSFAPMQFNTALSLFLVSLAVIFLNKKNENLAIKTALIAFVIPVITFFEYVLKLDLAVDNFFFEGPMIDTHVDHLNRMSFITTISFMIMCKSIMFIRHKKIFKILPTLSLCLALISFFGYLFNIEGGVISNFISGMAMHTSLSFMMIAFSMILIYSKKKFNFVEKLPGLVFCILVILSILSWQFAYQENEQNFQENLEIVAQDEITDIKIKISQYEQALLGAKGFVKGSNFISLIEWKHYVESINVNTNLSGLNGIGFIDYVADENIDDYLRNMQKTGLKGFVNHPKTNFKDKFVIRYIEPVNVNAKAVGLDIGFEKNRRSAAQHAIDTGISTLTDVIYLVQDDEQLAGFLLLVPVYKKAEKELKSVKDRRKNIVGWVYAPFMVKRLIEDASYQKNSSVTLEIYAEEKNNPHNLIYSNKSSLVTDKELIKKIEFSGKRWSIIFYPKAEFLANNQSNYPYWILFIGLFLSSLIYFAIYSITKLYGFSAKKASDLSKILEASHNEIFIFDIHNFNYIFANKGACENLGYSLEELKNMTPVDIKPEYNNEDLSTLVKPILDGKKEGIKIETLHKRKDKTTYHAEIYIEKGRYLGQEVFVSITIDSTERKKNEVEIEESKNFLELINNSIPDFIFVKDQDFVIVQANNAFLNLYPEDKRDKVIGYTTFEDYHPDEKDEFLKMDKKAFKEGYSEINETIHFPDGRERVLFTQKIRFKNLQGKEFILGISRDITEKEKLISKLSDANEELQNFAYICSHDLQEPLRMVRSFSEKLKMHLTELIKGDDKAQTYLRFVTDGATRGQNLVSDILDYSSINKDLKLNDTIDLMTIMSNIKTNLLSNPDYKGSEINFDALPILKGSKTQIYQLLMNLVTNGIKYQKEGNKAIVTVSAIEEDFYWKISIQDNGIGINADQFDKVFEVFKRLHAKSDYAGTGIGLSICKKVVKNHGGNIWIESEEGKGSSFHFTIKKEQNLSF